MKALIAYYTKTGNTEKVARAIYDAVQADKEILPVEDVRDWKGYDIVFCGFPVHAHSVPGKVAPVVRQLPPGQAVAFFSTHGSLRGGQLPRQAFEHALGLASKARVLGHFGCRGKVDPAVLEALRTQHEHRAWAEEAPGALHHPDDHDLADARDFALRMMAKVR